MNESNRRYQTAERRPPVSHLRIHCLIVTLLLSTLTFTSCSSPEVYYRLNADGPAPAHTAGMALGIGPVNLPDYIDRAELVFQAGPNRFEVPYNQRWAGSLREGVTQALATNLARRLGTGNLFAYPWSPGTSLDRQVIVDIRRFHAVSGGDVILEAAWQIRDPMGGDGTILERGNGSFTEALAGDGYDAVVAAQSRLLAKLADAVAADFPPR